MDEQPITEGVAPSNSSEQAMREELKPSVDCLPESDALNINKEPVEKEINSSCIKSDKNFDSLSNDNLPNNKHLTEITTQPHELELNNCEDQNKEIIDLKDSDINNANIISNECIAADDAEETNTEYSKINKPHENSSIDSQTLFKKESNVCDQELSSNVLERNVTVEYDSKDNTMNTKNPTNCNETQEDQVETLNEENNTEGEEADTTMSNIQDDNNSITQNENENPSEINEEILNDENSSASIDNRQTSNDHNEETIDDSSTKALGVSAIEVDKEEVDLGNDKEILESNVQDEKIKTDKSTSKEDLTMNNDVTDTEDKKQIDESEVSPDFECSDIKEHVPSDEKHENNEKIAGDEIGDKEEDPFDQVVNEVVNEDNAMEVDDNLDKQSYQNKEANSFEKSDDKNDYDDLLEKETSEEMQVDHTSEETEELHDFESSKGADEEICLLPDTEREISEADKERAILAKEILAKEAANKEAQDTTSVFDTLVEGSNSEKSDDKTKSNSDEKLSSLDNTNNDSTTDECKMEVQGDDQNDLSFKECDDKDAESEPLDTTEPEHDITEPLKENVIQEIHGSEQTCTYCSQVKLCKFHMLIDGSVKYLCQKDCVLKYKVDNDQYNIIVKKIIIKEIASSDHLCVQCTQTKMCQYEIHKEGNYLCDDSCIKKYKDDAFGNFVIRYRKVFVQEITPIEQLCSHCDKAKSVKFLFNINNEEKYICDDECLLKLQEQYPDKYRVKVRKLFRVKEMPRLLNISAKDTTESPTIVTRSEEAAEAVKLDRDKSFHRKCTMCDETITGDEKNLSWETMDFCNEDCLSKYQNTSYSNCSNCKTAVHTTSLGKYCVRFGYDVRQFCSSSCLEEFKKGLKVCSYCQKDISGGSEGFLAPVGDKGQFKDFCTQTCMEKFDQMSKNCPPMNVVNQCAVCKKDKVIKVEIFIDGFDHKLCSNPCFSAFKFVNKLFPDQCDMCKKYYERKSSEHYTIYEDTAANTFCSKTCMNVFILSNRQIVPCNWCKVKKYNYDMIRRNLNSGQTIMMCSLNCLTLYQVSVNAVSMRRIKCDHCKSLSQAQYHLTMSDATIRNFCTYQCVMAFQGQYSKNPITLGNEQHKTPSLTSVKGAPVPTGVPKRTYNITRQTKGITAKTSSANKSFETPIISKVRSLGSVNVHNTRGSKTNHKAQIVSQTATSSPTSQPTSPPPKPQFKTQLIVKPPPPKHVANISTMCKPILLSKGTSCRQQSVAKECQTDDSLQKRILIPIPVPIYVPTPLNMYSLPYPVPVPIPLPIPVPVFIPTTRNSANGIMKEIKKIHEKMPTDPFEAELLMMAEMVAGDKKRSESDSDSEEEAPEDEGFSPEGMETSNTFGEDMLQMALKMASEYDEPAVDLESAMTASTITPSSHPPMTNEEGVDDPNPMHHHHMLMMEQQRAAIRGRKRPNRPQGNSLGNNKRNRRVSNTDGLPMMQPPTQPEPPREPTEKPDANMCLKYTFGVNAWKQWVMTKNADLEKSSIRRKPFKSEILQLTADELNYSLCLFVKEVRKPNGSEYAPDTIYYLVLGIQQYLFENGRIDNIFTDAYYEKFTECLDEVAKKFSVLYNDSQYIVTRVEEEHLWESKQLGAHSPHVLLSTLMFFNTKHFNLVTVEEHMQLSFSHIMKHWKRNPNQPGATKVPGSRNVLLRFYPPQSALDANSRKKKVYEQQENEENPLRCPVKLYEFYLSKCPESVKTRNDVFYLLPERSCVPDSPVWYSTMALGKEPLQKMLHRVKMVKEINIALLTS